MDSETEKDRTTIERGLIVVDEPKHETQRFGFNWIGEVRSLFPGSFFP